MAALNGVWLYPPGGKQVYLLSHTVYLVIKVCGRYILGVLMYTVPYNTL